MDDKLVSFKPPASLNPAMPTTGEKEVTRFPSAASPSDIKTANDTGFEPSFVEEFMRRKTDGGIFPAREVYD